MPEKKVTTEESEKKTTAATKSAAVKKTPAKQASGPKGATKPTKPVAEKATKPTKKRKVVVESGNKALKEKKLNAAKKVALRGIGAAESGVRGSAKGSQPGASSAADAAAKGVKAKPTPLEKYNAKQSKKSAKAAQRQEKELARFKKQQGALRERADAGTLRAHHRKWPFVLLVIAIVIVLLLLGSFLFTWNHWPGTGLIQKVNSNYVSWVDDLHPSIAATVNGVPVKEQNVTDYIANLRKTNSTSSQDLTTDSTWTQALQAQGTTAAKMRENIIKNVFAPTLLTQQWADQLGIKTDMDAINKTISDNQAAVGAAGNDANWLSILQTNGYYSVDYYRMSLVQKDQAKQIGQTLQPFDPTATYTYDSKTKTTTVTAAGTKPAPASATDKANSKTAKKSTSSTSSDDQDNTNAKDVADAYVKDFKSYCKDHVARYCKDQKIPVATYDPANYAYKTLPADILNGLKGQWQQQDSSAEDNKNNASYDGLTVGQADQFAFELQQHKDQADIVVDPMPTGLAYDTDKSAPGDNPASTDNTKTDNSNGTTTVSSQEEATKDGLVIKDDTVGSGKAVKAGDSCEVLYIGTLDDGTVFDSNTSDSQTVSSGKQIFTFTAGASGQVIEGWKWGVIGMKVGGVRELTIPASLGYGSQAQGSIPANSTLHFKITLKKIK
ncbi:MAG: FKBP-type peptidyl-prolyl cis-trans isomerase [Coriobacteriales bacterium]|jgi:FKBP-type peptidyl-prolyl cis-trans isomerase|nr:FKBP-type peptidyl-prolyl cis-trans isomerase [Coriobacteriales bacterium]